MSEENTVLPGLDEKILVEVNKLSAVKELLDASVQTGESVTLSIAAVYGINAVLESAIEMLGDYLG